MSYDNVMSSERKVLRKRDTVISHNYATANEPLINSGDEGIYKQIVEGCAAIVFTHDFNGKFLTVNPHTASCLGYAHDELVGSYFISLVPEKYRVSFFESYLSQLRKNTSSRGIIQVLTKYGKKKHWLYNNNIHSDSNNQPYVICFAQDITDKVELEESLKLNNDTFRSAFDYSGIGMALISPDGTILDANNAVCNFTGYIKGELLKLNFLDLTHPDDNKTDQSLLHKMLIKVINHYSIEKRYISKTKKVLWGLHTVSKVANMDGTPKFFILQIIDITKKKELADELNWKNSELEAIKSGLINKISQLEELNYIIAHNLRGPANNIKLLVDMLKTNDEPQADTSLKLELSEIVEFLDEGSTSLLGSLNTLMEVVQISMNKTIPYDDCDAKKIVCDTINQLNSVIFEKNASIKGNIEVSTIHYPRVFLESILYNLISNAIKYSAKDRQPEILVSTYALDDKVVISVKDNGLGINLDRYGNKIFKLNQTFHKGYDSKGVGLFITKAQIESFGGTIKVKSKENEGTEFIVTL